MEPNKIAKLLFFCLVFLQFQVKAQTIINGGLTIISSGTPDSNHLLSPANLNSLGLVTVNGGLTLQPSTTLLVSGTSLTVAGGINFGAGSILYLRAGAQLIQNDAVANSGSGVVSIYQEGTVNNNTYNYWCSPINNGSGNFGVSMLGTPNVDATSMTPVTTNHSANYDGTATTHTLNIEPYWINTFLGTAYSQWTNVGSAVSIPSGYGFSMKGVFGTDTTRPSGEASDDNPGSAQRYEFRGTPNNGNVSTAISLNTSVSPTIGNFTLIGNPYPSAVDLNAFFSDPDNFDTDQVAYFWEQAVISGNNNIANHNVAKYTGGYGVYTPFGFSGAGNAVYVPATFYNYDGNGNAIACTTGCSNSGNRARRYSPIGQGFMVKADQNFTPSGGPVASGNPWNGDGIVIMKNSFRTYKAETTDPTNANGSVFSKKEDEATTSQLPQIRFNTTYDNGAIGQMVQVFIPESTAAIDKGKDVRTPNYGPTQVNLLVGDDRCVISSVPFDINVKIPLIFDNEAQATYKMTVQEMINLDQVSNVYIHDKRADKYYDIKNDFYQFTLPQGTNYFQYEITFRNAALSVNDVTAKSFEIFQNNEAKKFIISNPFQKELVSCELYDIAGKLIFSKKQLGIQPSYEFSTAGLSDGIYIVRASSQDNEIKAQKIAVKR